MIESEFWEQLRSRINMTGNLASLGYCDWLEPRRYALGAPGAHVQGAAGFVSPDSRKLTFQLSLPDDATSSSEIDWETLLPSPESSEWVTISNNSLVVNTLSAGSASGAA
jgi:hypothetical protein